MKLILPSLLNKYILIFSVIWLTFGTFLYFDHLVHYPKSYIEHFEMKDWYDCFNYVDDEYRKEDAMQYAKSHGHEHQANLLIAMGLRFLKPTFSLYGYIYSQLFPLFCLCILAWSYIKRRILNKGLNDA